MTDERADATTKCEDCGHMAAHHLAKGEFRRCEYTGCECRLFKIMPKEDGAIP